MYHVSLHYIFICSSFLDSGVYSTVFSYLLSKKIVCCYQQHKEHKLL